MKYAPRVFLLRRVYIAASVLAFASSAWSGPCWDCRKPAINMPISMAMGTVRTSEFSVKRESYNISIDVKWLIPPPQLNCMMGTKQPWKPDHCAMYHYERLLDVDWVVWDGNVAVARGSVHGTDDNFDTTKDRLSRYLGSFTGEKNKKFVLEIKFTKDATPLNVTDPHLVVMMTKSSDLVP